VNPIIDTTPTDDIADLLKIALKMKTPKEQGLSEIYQMMLAPVATVLDQYFESDVLKATLSSDGVIGAMCSPYS
jgi:phytoene dehydrogenase-like protein